MKHLHSFLYTWLGMRGGHWFCIRLFGHTYLVILKSLLFSVASMSRLLNSVCDHYGTPVARESHERLAGAKAMSERLCGRERR